MFVRESISILVRDPIFNRSPTVCVCVLTDDLRYKVRQDATAEFEVCGCLWLRSSEPE